MAHPDWAVKHRRPGTELRCIKGRYCLYECTSVYDKEKKRAVKKTGKYLGSITEHGGFKESRKRILERELEQALQQPQQSAAQEPSVGQVKELGVSRFVSGPLGWYVDKLKEYFPVDWRRIVALAYCRLCGQSPMKRMSADYRDSYLSVIHSATGLSANRLSGFYHELGGRRSQILAFLNEFGLDGDNVIFDGTDILSASQGMDLPKMSKVKSGGFGTAINIMFGYSVGAGTVNYYRLLPGNIKDIKAFKLCAQEYAHKSLTIIVDKGFQSEANIEYLDSIEGTGYVMALKRNTKGLDYSPFASRDNKGAMGHFSYNGRVLWYCKQEVCGHEACLYLDERRRVEEETDYLSKADDPDNDHYSMESYQDHVLQFGTIALLNGADKDPQELYYAYKSRGEIEQAIDVFKNTLEADTSSMQSRQALEAWMFINMVALHWYYELRQRLIDTELIKKFSPADMIALLQHLRIVYVDGAWRTAELTKKEGDAIAALGVDIT
ncbi:MAG: transposase [Muribaculaceae bacterium]|nr:transposase [Muribaculaceae bacterium]